MLHYTSNLFFKVFNVFICCRHSAGCLVAVDSYFESPERVAALILVAPAIFAPRPVNTAAGAGDNRGENGPRSKFLGTLVELSKVIIGAISRALTGMASMLSSLYKKALAAFLRSYLGVMLVPSHFHGSTEPQKDLT